MNGRFHGSSAQARGQISEKYPAVRDRDAAWPTGEARDLYSGEQFETPRWCAWCGRAYDATRIKGTHRLAEAGTGVRHGGPAHVFCSTYCSAAATQTRYMTTPVWRQCACGTWWRNHEAIPVDGRRRAIPRIACPPAWTPNEEHLYTTLTRPCESDPELAKVIAARRRLDEAERRRPQDTKRAAKRAEERAKARTAAIDLCLLVERFERAETDVEKRAVVASATGATKGATVEYVVTQAALVHALAEHLNATVDQEPAGADGESTKAPACRRCHAPGFAWGHDHAPVVRLAAQGKLEAWLKVQAEHDEARHHALIQYGRDD
jgi:cytochrome c553